MADRNSSKLLTSAARCTDLSAEAHSARGRDGVFEAADEQAAFERAWRLRLAQQSSKVRLLRAWARRPQFAPVRVVHGDTTQFGVLTDISRCGAGVVGSFNVQTGDLVELQFVDGRIVPARVRWRKSERFGVVFTDALAPQGHLDCAVQSQPSAGNKASSELRLLRWIAKRLPKTAAQRKHTNHSMVERACRKQGFAWLVEE